MKSDAGMTQVRGWRRVFWCLLALLLGGLAGIELVGYASQATLARELERGAGRVAPSKIEELRRRNEELGRDPKRSAEKFREDLLFASLRSLPWAEYLDRAPLRWMRLLFGGSVFFALLAALCAFLLGMGRGSARWGLFLASLGQILSMGIMALLATHVSASYAEDLLRDLRIRQDEVAAAIGTQAPIAKISIPEERRIRAVGALLFLVLSSPWQLTLLLSSRPRRKVRPAPAADAGEASGAGEFVEALEVVPGAEDSAPEAADDEAAPRDKDPRREDGNR
jgi:hypothetical protein